MLPFLSNLRLLSAIAFFLFWSVVDAQPPTLLPPSAPVTQVRSFNLIPVPEPVVQGNSMIMVVVGFCSSGNASVVISEPASGAAFSMVASQLFFNDSSLNASIAFFHAPTVTATPGAVRLNMLSCNSGASTVNLTVVFVEVSGLLTVTTNSASRSFPFQFNATGSAPVPGNPNTLYMAASALANPPAVTPKLALPAVNLLVGGAAHPFGLATVLGSGSFAADFTDDRDIPTSWGLYIVNLNGGATTTTTATTTSSKMTTTSTTTTSSATTTSPVTTTAMTSPITTSTSSATTTTSSFETTTTAATKAAPGSTTPSASCPAGLAVPCSCSGNQCTVQGSVSTATLSVSSTTVLDIQGSLTLSDRLNVVVDGQQSSDASCINVRDTLTLSGGTLTLRFAGTPTPQSVLIARSAQLNGQFTSTAWSAPSDCANTPSVSQQSTQTSISALVTVSNTCGLSGGQIAGIVIGTILAALLLAMLIVVLTKWARNRQTDTMQRKLRQAQLKEV